MLVNGKWDADWQPVQNKDKDGRFIRQVSSFRHWITPDGSPGPTGDGGFKAEAGRYLPLYPQKHRGGDRAA